MTLTTDYQDLMQAVSENNLYDYISNNFYKFDKYDLARIIKELSFCLYTHSIEEKEIFNDLYDALNLESY